MSLLASSCSCSALAAASTTCASSVHASSSIERNCGQYSSFESPSSSAASAVAVVLPTPHLRVLDPGFCELTAVEFEQKGNLLFKDPFKLVIQFGPYVLKEILLISSSFSEEQSQNHSLLENFSIVTTSEVAQLRESGAAVKTGIHQKQEIHSKKLMKFCETLQNEMHIANAICERFGDKRQSQHEDLQRINKNSQRFNTHYILTPLAYGRSTNRCLLLSPFMSERDSWAHLIQKNLNVFKLLEDTFSGEISDFQRSLLTRTRFILFGAMKLTFSIATALSHLHDTLKFAHNDIKPDNFFAHAGKHPLLDITNESNNSEDDDGVAYYLSDLGFAKRAGFTSSRDAKRFFLQKHPTYLSPEIFQLLNDDHQGDLLSLEMSSDVFAFGVSLFQILFQTNPFQHSGCSSTDYYYSLLDTNPNKFWETLTKQLRIYDNMTDTALLKDLLVGMLHKDPLKRLTARQVLSHQWLEDIQHYLFQETRSEE